MCERYSWLNVDGKIVFLTGRDVFHTKRGRELRKYSQCSDDWHGHGAIRWYYNLKSDVGTECECIDFSTPKNFPAEIAEAIKAGEMWEFGVSNEMCDMLTKRAQAKYEKARDDAQAKYEKAQAEAWAKYEKARDEAWAEYAEVCDEAWAKYEKARDKACAEYRKARAEAWAKYEKSHAKACDEYDKAWAEYRKARDEALAESRSECKKVFISLFSDPKNRIKAWR